MDNNMKLDEHTSQRYNAELEAVRNRVLTMGGLVEKQCRQALQALLKGDAELASEVDGADYEVNDLEIEISDRSLMIPK